MYFLDNLSSDFEIEGRTEPSRDQVKVTFGAPCALQINLPFEPLSLADFEISGERSIIGLSVDREQIFLITFFVPIFG